MNNVIILMGLPGSGKTEFAMNLVKNRNDIFPLYMAEYKDPTPFGEHYQETAIRKTKLNGMRRDTLLIDGEIYTMEMLERILDEIVYVYSRTAQFSLTIHWWEGNRMQCLNNTGHKRDKSVYNCITKQQYDKIDITYIKKKYRNITNVVIQEHSVIERPYWYCKYAKHINIQPGGYLYSKSWVIGGHSINYDNEPNYISPEPAYEFTELYDCLDKLYPNLLAKDERRLNRHCIHQITKTKDDVGECIYYKMWVCDLGKMFHELQEMGYEK